MSGVLQSGDILLLLILCLRWAVDLGLEGAREAIRAGSDVWDPDFHLLGCAVFVLAIHALSMVLGPLFGRSLAPPSTTEQVRWRALRRLELWWPAAARWCHALRVCSFLGGVLGALADRVQLDCFLALGAVRFRVLNLAMTFRGCSSRIRHGGLPLKLALFGCLLSSLFAFGLVAMPTERVSADSNSVPANIGVWSLVRFWALQLIVDYVRIVTFKSPQMSPDEEQWDSLAWFSGLAAGHVVLFICSRWESALQELAAVLPACLEHPQICLILLQMSLWCFVPKYVNLPRRLLQPISTMMTAAGVLRPPWGPLPDSLSCLRSLEVVFGTNVVVMTLFCVYFIPDETTSPLTNPSHQSLTPAGTTRAAPVNTAPDTLRMVLHSVDAREVSPNLFVVGPTLQARTDNDYWKTFLQVALRVLPAVVAVVVHWLYRYKAHLPEMTGACWLFMTFSLGSVVLLGLKQLAGPAMEVSAGGVQASHNKQPRALVAECAVCLESEAVYVAVPCGHLAICATCLASLKRTKGNAVPRSGKHRSPDCIICRERTREFVRVFT
eukprot:CAMPEP_0179014954 /NCGR_PEP_ID=MMETSP0796-20121207/2533_1 /TAXON_ID=73915 /ORGANISM="Pyrodinium bahamense, Strain pbaha01" /LENGTH=551 /DNA_ID=CAMNT_0020710555 /DNA_START=98 /DNA_END=1753 /DNA_ORIENTATION=+